MAITITLANRQSLLNSYTTLFGAAAQIAIFSGSAPANADTAFAGNAVIAACPFSSTPFGAASAATPSVITANAITVENAYANATATFYRAYAQGTPGITTSGFVIGNTYMVQTPGTSTLANYQAIGLNAGITSLAAGQMFIATGTTITGNGTAYLMNTIEQGSCGTSASDMIMNTTTLTVGGSVTITPCTRQM
jgi:hypothetical protein